MNFLNFNGNNNLKSSLNALEKQNRMPHAIIINGGNLESRNQLASHLAMWAVCSQEEKPCYSCKNCLNAESKSHSDIYFAKGEGKTNIYNKEELNKIIKDSFIKPNQADRKVYILEECDRRFPIISQNAFLKTLEEPPQDVLFIMTCENSNVLLSTILSRATVFTLEREEEINSETLSLAKEIALGIVVSSELELLKATYKLNTRDLSIEVLSYVISLLRDGLAVSVGSTPVTDADTATRLCKKLTKTQYLKLIEITQDAIRKISQNVSLKLISTWLCGEYRRISWQR